MQDYNDNTCIFFGVFIYQIYVYNYNTYIFSMLFRGQIQVYNNNTCIGLVFCRNQIRIYNYYTTARYMAFQEGPSSTYYCTRDLLILHHCRTVAALLVSYFKSKKMHMCCNCRCRFDI